MNTIPFLIDLPLFARDEEKLQAALVKLTANDPSLGFAEGKKGAVLLKGVSEEQLDAAIDTLKRENSLEFDIGAPLTAYRERLTKTVKISYIHKKQIFGAGEFAGVT